jgi:hypothetical protein
LVPGGRKMDGPSEDTGNPWELEVIRGDSGGKRRDTRRQKNQGEIKGDPREIQGKYREI